MSRREEVGVSFVVLGVLEPQIARHYTIRHRISSSSLLKRLSIEPFDKYYNRRLLRWTGHVARMPLTRAPIKIITSLFP
jgi:hypothetical protein